MIEFFGLPASTLGLILFCAFLSSLLHGATGMAGGIVMTAVLAHLLDAKQAVPIVTTAMLFSHSARCWLFKAHTDYSLVKWVLGFSIPTIALGAWLFSFMDAQLIAAVMAAFLGLSFPLKMYTEYRQIKTSRGVLAAASLLWGVLAGNVIGPGFVLAPFLLGTGIDRMRYVATLAHIVLVMNVIKLLVFSSTSVVDSQLLALGIVVGISMIPGNWIGRNYLRSISDLRHRHLIDVMTVIVMLNFAYLAIY